MGSENDDRSEYEKVYITVPLDGQIIFFLEENPGSTWWEIIQHFILHKICDYATLDKHLEALCHSKKIVKKIVTRRGRFGYYASETALWK